MNLLIKILTVVLYLFFLIALVIGISSASSWMKLGNNQPETPSRFTANPIPEVKSRILNADSKPPAKVMDLAAELRKPIRSKIPIQISDQSQFSFDLYQAIRSTPGNLVYSPYSISTALAMAYVGAKGNTEQQMSKALHFPYPQDPANPAVNSDDLKLTGSTSGESANRFKLKVANSIWGQKSYAFRPEYLATLSKNFSTELQLVDFQSDTGRQQAGSAINRWVSQSTEGMINQLIKAEDLTEDTRLILANAIYFKADWANKFKLDFPFIKFKFTLLDGNTVTFPRMSINRMFTYWEEPGYQAVQLPYKGQPISMVIVLPAKGEFESIEKQFNAQFVGQVLANLRPRQVDLYMPKFKYETQLLLANPLSSMGMPDAFIYKQADFSGMDGTKELFISKIVHKAVIAVDETGTEVVAATAQRSGIACGGSPEAPVSMRINRPFLFLIRDVRSDTVLFIGRVLNPSEK